MSLFFSPTSDVDLVQSPTGFSAIAQRRHFARAASVQSFEFGSAVVRAFSGLGLMLTWRELASLRDDELGRQDIAALNLACAEGLPGTEQINPAQCLSTLDRWAEKVRQSTAAAYREFFLSNPGEFSNSEASFRIIALLPVLSRHCGVRYDSSKEGLTPNDGGFEVHEPFVFGVTDLSVLSAFSPIRQRGS